VRDVSQLSLFSAEARPAALTDLAAESQPARMLHISGLPSRSS
jgi:hypothetical protein